MAMDFRAIITGEADLTKAKQSFVDFKKQVETPIKLTFDTNGLNAVWTNLQKQAQQSGVQIGNSLVQGVQKNIRNTRLDRTAMKSMFDGIVPDEKFVFNGSALESVGMYADAVKALKKEFKDMESGGGFLKSFRLGDDAESFTAEIYNGVNSTIKIVGTLGDILNDQGDVVGHRWQTNQSYVVDYSNTIRQAQTEARKLTEEVAKVGNAFTGKEFDRQIAEMEAGLSNISKDVPSNLVKKASDSASEYYQIAQKIQDNYSGKNPLQEQDLVNAYAQARNAAMSYQNTMFEISATAKTMGVDTGNAVKQAVNEVNKLASAVDKVKEVNTKGVFDKNLDKMENGLLGIDSTVPSSIVKEASDAASQYYAVVQQIQDTINKTAQNPLTEEQLVGAYKDSKIYLDQFNNAMERSRLNTQKMLAEGVGNRDANDLEGWAKKNTRALKDYGKQIDELAQKLRNAKTPGERNDLLNQVKNLKSEINAAGKSGMSFADNFKRAFVHIGEFTWIYAITSQLRQLPQEMFQEVLKIDTAMTELKKVSTASASEISNYFEQASDSASKYGQTIDEVIQSTASWTRLGYDLDDASILTDVTAELAQVGSGLTVDTATEGLQATIRGFSMAADEAKRVGDMINYIADTEPIDAIGIINGLERSSSAMAEANNSLEETIGLITASTSVTQDATSAGTAWRTISMRIRGKNLCLHTGKVRVRCCA